MKPRHHLAGEGTDESDADPEESEHGRKPEHERERVNERARALSAAERGFTGHVDEEGRNERKHAGGEKREDPGTEGDRDVH